MPPLPLYQPFPPIIPGPFPFGSCLSILGFCESAAVFYLPIFALFLYLTEEWHNWIIVFLHLAYFTEHNTL